ncbi:MAG TPA: acyltransferase [Candidatus Aquabacterium excrementipullorum]|nr:acyltransferase [Candidatus Aquabacterium excrementipullorum]
MKLSAPSLHAAAAHTKTLLGLELMRFACALSVLVWHYQHFYYVGGVPAGFSREVQPWFEWLQPLYHHGFLGVQAFWCLSGFIFFWKYAEPVAGGRVAGWRFAALRFSRLYPLHLLTLLIVAALLAVYHRRVGGDYVYANNDALHFGLQLFMVSDWGSGFDWSFNGPIWSISIEILVYAIFFGLCRLGLVRWWHAVAVIAATGVVYALKLTMHPVVLCLFFFYLGGLTQLVHQALLSLAPGRQRAAQAVIGLALVAGTVLAATGLLRPMFYVALLTPAAALLLLAWVHPRSARAASLISTLGNTTYASYLLHFPLQLLLATAVGAPLVEHLPLASPWWLLGYLSVVFALATVVYRRIELPAQDWLRARLLPATR